MLGFDARQSPLERIHVAGVVTQVAAGKGFYIQEGAAGLSVRTVEPPSVQPGDDVEVAGFPALGPWNPILEDAIFRRRGSKPLPKPTTITPTMAAGGNYDAQFVRMEGVLLETSHGPEDHVLALRAAETIVLARLPKDVPLQELREGSNCTIRSSRSWPESACNSTPRRQVERVARACPADPGDGPGPFASQPDRGPPCDSRFAGIGLGARRSGLRAPGGRDGDGSGLPVRIPVRVEGPPRRLSGTTEAHLLRIAQEAMSNAIKHGRAEEVALTLALSMQVACIRSHNRRITAMTTRTLMIACLTGLFVLSATGNAVAVEGLELGTNFWNPGWHRPSDCFRDLKNVSGEDPWNPQFLKEVAIFKSLRFMDWDNTNGSRREKWGERPHKSDRKQNPVAYEWMIDLCNRQHADLWVTLPHRTVTHAIGDRPCDYALRLCLLVKTGVDMGEVDLQPLLDRLARMKPEELIAAGGKKSCEPLSSEQKLYVEYSNETWNGMFKQAHYCCDEGEAAGTGQEPLDGRVPLSRLGRDPHVPRRRPGLRRRVAAHGQGAGHAHCQLVDYRPAPAGPRRSQAQSVGVEGVLPLPRPRISGTRWTVRLPTPSTSFERPSASAPSSRPSSGSCPTAPGSY